MSSSNRHHHKTGGGTSQGNSTTLPRFATISPSAGQAYLTAARKCCLQTQSEVVTTFCRGILPMEILEKPLSYDKRTMLGRKSGKYHDSEGNLVTVDQSVIDWRKQLISETRSENGDCSEEAALELLFPASGKKAREFKRQLFASQSLQLLHNLNLLWPTDAMSLEMDKDKAIQDATNCQDLIAWENAFTKFCLDNCGNADMNVRAAEDALDATVMRGMDLNIYVKSFRIAYNNARQCKSTYTERRIVELFIRNLNQSSEAFYGFSRRILDVSDPLYALVSKPLESAITYVENFHKSVIVPELAAAKRQAGQSSSATVKSLKDLKNLVDSNSASGSNNTSVSVTYPVLAAMLKNINNNNNNNNNKNNNNFDIKNNNNNNNNSNKRRAAAAAEEARKKAATTAAKAATAAAATATATAEEIKAEDKEKNTKRLCYNFRAGNCAYGDNCHYAHKT